MLCRKPISKELIDTSGHSGAVKFTELCAPQDGPVNPDTSWRICFHNRNRAAIVVMSNMADDGKNAVLPSVSLKPAFRKLWSALIGQQAPVCCSVVKRPGTLVPSRY